jgi:glycosyltransferase involved in cell wall biosynthesis
VIFSGGNHLRDLETLRTATERLPAAVHPVDLYAPGERFAGNSHLRHRGQVDIASFCQAVARSRFMVLPVQEDPTRAAGITVLAMALRAGRPIVASSTAAMRDYLQHDVDALLVPPGDPEALAEAIARLDTDPELLSRLADGARRTGERMSTEHWAEQILSGTPLIPLRTPLGWRNW